MQMSNNGLQGTVPIAFRAIISLNKYSMFPEPKIDLQRIECKLASEHRLAWSSRDFYFKYCWISRNGIKWNSLYITIRF